MKNLLALVSSALVACSLALGGCAESGESGESGESDTSADETKPVVSVDVDGVTPSRLGAGRSGYIPRVMLADLKAAGARCIGTHCDYNGGSWDCSGGGYCTNVSR